MRILKSIGGFLLRFAAALFCLLLLLGGGIGILIKLSSTINYQSVEEIAIDRFYQVLFCLPNIIVGAYGLFLLIFGSISRRKHIYLPDKRGYCKSVLIVGLVLFAVFFAIIFCFSRHPLVNGFFLCVSAAFFIFLYGIYLVTREKSTSD